MKIVFLNVWWGELQKQVNAFIEEQIASTDVFCFQEAGPKFVYNSSEILKDYQKLWAEKPFIENVFFEQSIYVKKQFTIKSNELLMNDSPKLGLGLATQIFMNESVVNVCNFHGISLPAEKLDCPERIEQSRILIEFFKSLTEPKIIGGDFNLEPDTDSIEIFEKNGYRNLIEEFRIKTTRNKLAWIYPKKLFFSDYVFVSPDVKVKSFSVPDLEISDHLPMILEIE